MIPHHDLDLAIPRDRDIFEARFDRVVLALCEWEADERRLGERFNHFNARWCVDPTRKSILRMAGWGSTGFEQRQRRAD